MLQKLAKIREYGLKESARRISKKMVNRYYQLKARRAEVWQNPDESALLAIEESLRRRHLPLVDFYVQKKEFQDFKKEFPFGDNYFAGEWRTHLEEKLLEHFLAYKLAIQGRCRAGDVYVDVAASDSPWARLLRDKGIRAYAVDLKPSGEFAHLEYYLVMDATRTTFADQGVTAVSLQCAFEMFNGNDDIRLIEELARLLKANGRAVIVPLYLQTFYGGYASADYFYRRQFQDRDAKVFLAPHRMLGIPFARFYDVKTLEERILRTVADNGMQYRIYVLRNGPDLGSGIYCRFILEIIK